MANNNTKSRNRARNKQLRKEGFPKPGFKARKNHYPRPNKDVDMSLRAQSLAYHGKWSKFAA